MGTDSLSPVIPDGCLHFTDAKPTLRDLQCMSYTGEDGRTVFFRLLDCIKPRLTEMAIALSFPGHVIDVLKKNSESVYYLLSEWLQGRNQEYNSRPLTWGTLITALQHAGLLEEVRILEEHFVAARPPIAERPERGMPLVYMYCNQENASGKKLGKSGNS